MPPKRQRKSTIEEFSEEEELPEELRSRKVFHNGHLAFTIRPDKLPGIDDIVCEPFIQESSNDELIRMYQCPQCTVTHRTENWTKLREHAKTNHNLSLFKHNVVKLTSADRRQTSKCTRLRIERRKHTRLQLLEQHTLRQQTIRSTNANLPLAMRPDTVSVEVQANPVPMSLLAIAETASSADTPSLPGLVASAETASSTATPFLTGLVALAEPLRADPTCVNIPPIATACNAAPLVCTGLTIAASETYSG